MRRSDKLETILLQWTQRRDIPLSDKNDDGSYYLLFDQEYEVLFIQIGSIVRLETELGLLPDAQAMAEPLLDLLMKLQLIRTRENAEILSLDPELESIVLHRCMDAGALDLTTFDRALGEFVNAAAFWTRKIEGLFPDAQSRPSPFALGPDRLVRSGHVIY